MYVWMDASGRHPIDPYVSTQAHAGARTHLERPLQLQGQQVRVEGEEVQPALPDQRELAPDALVLQHALADERPVRHEVQLVVAGKGGAGPCCVFIFWGAVGRIGAVKNRLMHHSSIPPTPSVHTDQS